MSDNNDFDVPTTDATTSPSSSEDGSMVASTDATTSFQSTSTSKVGAHNYSEETAERTAGVGTEPGDSADEVDPRRLMGDPHINDIRWLYRTSLAQTLVNKPVDDAFKNGFEVESEGNRNIEALLDNHDYVEHYKRVKKKARRDGFALSYFVLEDDTDEVWEDPMGEDTTVAGVKKLEAITLDDMARYKTSHGAIPANTDADPLEDIEYDNYEIRPTGIVMDTDPTSDTYKEPLGYLIGPPDWVDSADAIDRVKFYHRNRFMHHVENTTVDGDLDDEALGRWEGDSVLVSAYHLLRGLKKGNWSLMQTIFRYAAKLYHVELPEDADDDDWEEANENMQNMNAKSELITPHGYEIDDFQTDGQLQPEEYFETIFEQICASSEMTKSVLFGTQSGTVSGSETDIKNYFNKVERMRNTDFEDDLHRFVNKVVSLVDGRASDDYDLDFGIEWGPMFKLSELDNAERLSRVMQTVSTAINDFVLTPEEARTILQEEWSEIDIDWEDDFSTEEKEWLQSLNVAQMGAEVAYKDGEEGEMEGNPRVGQNGGGMEQGEQTASEQPTSDSLSSRDVDRIAERVAEMIQNE
jgi:hypothetical protein